MLAYRFRLYPTPGQASALGRWCGCARAIYNAGLEQRQIAYRDCGVSLGYNQQGAGLDDLKGALPWLAEPHSDVLQQALRDLDRAYRNFFDGRAASPRFRRKGRRDSFRVQNRARGSIRLRRLNRRWGEVVVPKLGAVRFRWSRKPAGEIRHLTVTRDALGWHVSLCCEQPAEPAAHTGPAVGIDRGVAATVALSTGELHHCPGLPPGQAGRLRRLARQAGRQETARRRRPNAQRRRSRRHQRTLDALAKLKARETRVRRDFLHKLTTDLANNHGLVAIEDLRVTHMTRSAKGTIEQPGTKVAQKRGLNRAILAQGWGELARMLEYKLAQRGGALVKVPAAHTSQTCALCGVIDAASRKTQAAFRCVACGRTANADTNAAQVILAAGLVVTARGAHGEAGRGDEPRTTRRDLAHAA